MSLGKQTIWEWTAVGEVNCREAEREELKAGEAEVRIRAIGICSTDLHIVHGHYAVATPPMSLGHELAGTVERLGPGVTGLQPGDRVCIDPYIGCGVCAFCRAGNKHRCPTGAEIGIQLPGGWREYLNVPANNLYVLPEAISFIAATQLENIHCCLGAVDKLDIRLGDRAAVIGDGPSGLYFVQLLKAAGVTDVTLVGRREERLRLGRLIGADAVIDRRTDELRLPDESCAIVVDAVGSQAALDEALRILNKGGQLLMYGLSDNKVQLDVPTVIMKELRLQGSMNDPHVWHRVIALAASGTVRIEPIITHSYRFDQLGQALAQARDRRYPIAKAVIDPDLDMDDRTGRKDER